MYIYIYIYLVILYIYIYIYIYIFIVQDINQYKSFKKLAHNTGRELF